MTSETTVFGLLTVAIVAGTAVLLAGVGAFEHTQMAFVAVGGAIMVVGILAMAGYVQLMESPEGAEAEAGH